jgi:hypothetical protein
MSHDIYQILENLDAAQKSVKQLPALFRPRDTSPQLSGPYPGANATRGYLVGEGEGNANPMAQAVTRRIVNQHPEWITRYGVEFLMQAIEDVTEGDKDWEEIGSSDVSAYVDMVGDRLRDRGGDRSDIDEQDVAESQDNTIYQVSRAMLDNNPGRSYLKATEDEILADAAKELTRMGMSDIRVRAIMRDPDFAGELIDTLRGPITESATTEDVLSTVKKKLGDYLQDVATAIKKDPDLMAKLPQTTDDIKAVKTMKTADGHEIKITGNEDDGFRISIKNKNSRSKFANLDEAVLAVEMYCARRQQAVESADYIEEKR